MSDTESWARCQIQVVTYLEESLKMALYWVIMRRKSREAHKGELLHIITRNRRLSMVYDF